MAEVYKGLNNISLPFTLDYLKQKMNPYNLQNIHLDELTKCRTKTYGLNMTLFKEALLCNKLTNHFKEAKSLIHFKNKIRERTGRPCTCCICSQIVSFLKNVHIQKKISVVIQIYFQLLLLLILVLLFISYFFRPVNIAFICQ